jgi:aliphatic sulfonates family ABC transporter substrate-binding protein
MIARRLLLAYVLSSTAGAALAQTARRIRIGFQKGEPILIAAKQNRSFEAAFTPLGISVEWLEFPFGPPLLEAMRVGSIDVGVVGDTPPIFAQAAQAPLVYVAARPGAGGGMGILVPPGSKLNDLRDLKDKRVALAQGSAAQNLLIAALKKAGLEYTDIIPAYLAPADAAAAFAQGNIDAWSIWDPYLALGEARPGVRMLASGRDITPQNSFYLAHRDYATQQPEIIRKFVEIVIATGGWCDGNRQNVAKLLSDGTGVPLAIMRVTVGRADFPCVPISQALLNQQQEIADRFCRLHLIPRAIKVQEYALNPSA